MANKKCCCCDNEFQAKVEKLTLDDGRKAEKHSSFDEDGREVVEIFAEDKRPLHLEKRIIRERKQVLAKETHETVKDGQVVMTEVMGMEPDPPLQMRERIAVPDHAKVVDGDYVKREEIGRVVSDAVVDGIAALMENMNAPMIREKAPEPFFNAQSVVEQNVAEKKKGDSMINLALGGILIAQIAFFGYMFFVM